MSSFRVLRMRPAGCAGSSAGSPRDVAHHRDAGLEAGHAERELGEEVSETAIMSAGLPCSAVRAVVQSVTRCGVLDDVARRTTAMTTALRAR